VYVTFDVEVRFSNLKEVTIWNVLPSGPFSPVEVR
jgi:hypothetical protein